MCICVHMWHRASKLGPWMWVLQASWMGLCHCSYTPCTLEGHLKGPCCLYTTSWRPGQCGGCTTRPLALSFSAIGIGFNAVCSWELWLCAAGTCSGQIPNANEAWGRLCWYLLASEDPGFLSQPSPAQIYIPGIFGFSPGSKWTLRWARELT